ncbi:hypothetical protein BVRB_020680, partial [Beta vulgaris subsp. vulgaris]
EESTRPDELPRRPELQGALPALGPSNLLDDAGRDRNRRFSWDCDRAYVLLSGGCVPDHDQAEQKIAEDAAISSCNDARGSSIYTT